MTATTSHSRAWQEFCATKLGQQFKCPPGLPPRGFLVKPDGTVEHVVPSNAKDFSMVELQRLIGGGPVQCVSFVHFWAVCDEEFKYKEGLVRNPKATEAVMDLLLPGDWLAGDILFCSRGSIR